MASWGYYSCINQCIFLICVYVYVCVHMCVHEVQRTLPTLDFETGVLTLTWNLLILAGWCWIVCGLPHQVFCGCWGILTQVLRLEQQVLYGWTISLAYQDIFFRVSIAVGTLQVKKLGKDRVVYSGYTSISLFVIKGGLDGNSDVAAMRRQEQTQSQRGELLTGLLLVTCSVCFFTEPSVGGGHSFPTAHTPKITTWKRCQLNHCLAY